MANTRQTGRKAEDLAATYLANKGLKILERNFANRFGEIDIIAQDGEIIVFVEVKAKIGSQFGSPEEMVGPGKLRRVQNMGLIYLKGREANCRIDVVAVSYLTSGELERITHYECVT